MLLTGVQLSKGPIVESLLSTPAWELQLLNTNGARVFFKATHYIYLD